MVEASTCQGEHDVLLGDAGLDELAGDALLRPVVLDPHLAIADVGVDHGAVDAPAACQPAYMSS